jgi:hypothetical protein
VIQSASVGKDSPCASVGSTETFFLISPRQCHEVENATCYCPHTFAWIGAIMLDRPLLKSHVTMMTSALFPMLKVTANRRLRETTINEGDGWKWIGCDSEDLCLHRDASTLQT